MSEPLLRRLRRDFHAGLAQRTLTIDASGTVSNADKSSLPSKKIAAAIHGALGFSDISEKIAGQTAGSSFEAICSSFLTESLAALAHLRPGELTVQKGGFIASFQQYAHLDELQAIAARNRTIATALGTDYLIKPDIIIARHPEPDHVINAHQNVIDHSVATYSGLRQMNAAGPILHASVSCKWTLRSDRAQNARSEGLNLVRNRKGALPRIAVVTGEPLPSRIASLALGTGDIDCVYHFALHELRDALGAPGMEAYRDTLDMMIEGARLRDISDLPLDLLI